MRAKCPLTSYLLDVQIMELLLMQSPPVFCHPVPLTPKYFSQLHVTVKSILIQQMCDARTILPSFSALWVIIDVFARESTLPLRMESVLAQLMDVRVREMYDNLDCARELGYGA